jgi:hypothetical protein
LSGKIRRVAEMREVADGLWLWRRRYPGWREDAGWPPEVSSFCVTSRGVTLVLDALDPDDGAVWSRLDELRPSAVAYLKPDHFRDSARFAERWNSTLYGEAYVKGDFAPDYEPFVQTAPGVKLPGGVELLEDARWRQETPAYLPEQRALVFSDGVMCDPNDGLLRVWDTPWHERRVVPALRAILDTHEVEHVLVSHGEPAHTRDELVAALERETWH